MALIVRNVALRLDEPTEALLERVAARLHVPLAAIRQHAVVRRSLDARKGRDMCFIYSVELALFDGPRAEESCVRRLHGRNVALLQPAPTVDIEPGSAPLEQRPVIVGFGPAGMFAALRLAELGYRPLVLERGREVRRRHRDILQNFYREGVFNPESNLLFGEGGAGTYSDGKVYTRVSDPAVRDVLAVLCRFGANPDVLLDARPHIGSNLLPTIVSRFRRHIEDCGGEIRFETRVNDFEIEDGRLVALRTPAERLPVGPVLLGIGHSARDTYARLQARGVHLEARPFQFGVRIEHPQDLVNRWQYGPAADHPRLPPAEYQLIVKCPPARSAEVFSFCMCPGGSILPSNESANLVATNGASRSARSGHFANSGLVVTVNPESIGPDALAGLSFQRHWEELAFQAGGGGYRVPAQRCTDFLSGAASDGTLETSYPLGGRWCQMHEILPVSVVQALRDALPRIDGQMPGYAGREGIITGPESRASAPVRIVRDPATRQAVATSGLYPIGEGAGYAGGIVSAALDGLRSAETVIRSYRPPS